MAPIEVKSAQLNDVSDAGGSLSNNTEKHKLRDEFSVSMATNTQLNTTTYLV